MSRPRESSGLGPLSRRVVRWSAAAYRVALLRYPRWLRERHGADMLELFERLARDRVERGGLRGLVRLAWDTARDLARPVPAPLSRSAADAGGAGRAARRGTGNVAGSMAGGPGRVSGPTRGTREDLGFALRSLVREPRFSGLVVGVLAVGIALNTSVFAVLNAYLIRPLPYPAADRLVSVRGWQSVSWTEVEDVFERAVSWDLDVFTIVGQGRSRLAPGAWITSDFLDVYAVRAQLGRTFTPEEDGRGAAAVAMISHRLWQETFGGTPDVIGRSFRAYTSDRPDDAELFTIVGVLPADFWYLNDYTDVLVPIRGERAVYTGRLRPGVSPERAESALTEIAISRMEQVPPDFRVQVLPLQEVHVASVRPTLLVLQAAALLVLLIACANAGVLLLVRAARRARELGVRRALGASGGRLARQLVLEGLLIAVAAGALGAALAHLGLGLVGESLEARLGRSVPGGLQALSIDGTVLLAAAAICGLVGVAFGLVPVFTSGRSRLSSTLAGGGRGGSEPRGQRRARNVMVTAEVALSLALLTGAGLMLQSAVHLQRRDLGFEPSRLVRGVIGLRDASYPTQAERVDLFSRLADRLERVQGVERVAVASTGPFTGTFMPRPVEGLGDREVSRAEAVTWLIDEGYFATMGMPVLRGRGFSVDDAQGGEPVAVVSAALARDLWGSLDVIGRSVRIPPQVMPGMTPPEPGPWRRVVGVVEDVAREVGGSQAGDVYEAYRQAEPLWMSVLIRERPGAVSVVPAVEAAVSELDPEVPLSYVQRIDEAVVRAMAPTRAMAGLFAGFSVFALVLAMLGLYGVIAYAARLRQRDVAIRMALGADRTSVTSLFVRQGLAVVAAGLVVGTLGGYWLGRALESQLHGVAAGDATTHGILALALAATAGVAVWLPARRAAGADPMGVLREE